MQSDQIDETLKLFKASQRILIVSHYHPDMDSIGSSAALTTVLADAGKKVHAFIPGPTMPLGIEVIGAEKVLLLEWDSAFDPDLVVFLDCGDAERVGEETLQRISGLGEKPWINIDHHTGNPEFGSCNVIDANVSSTAEILFNLFERGTYVISPDVATFLYTGIVGDTGRFLFSNTKPSTFRAASKLIEAGAAHEAVTLHLTKFLPLETVKFYGEVLDKAKSDFDGKIIWSRLDHIGSIEIEDIVTRIKSGVLNHLLRIPQTEIAILFSHRANGTIRLNIRAWGQVDCALVASHFGGGGHKNAAGCTIDAPIDEAIAQTLSYIETNYESLKQ